MMTLLYISAAGGLGVIVAPEHSIRQQIAATVTIAPIVAIIFIYLVTIPLTGCTS